MPSADVYGILYNADVVALSNGMIVRVSGTNRAVRAQANSPANLQGIVGINASGIVGIGGPASVVGTASGQRVLCETGLAPVAGQTLYVSATVPGRATNVAPGNAIAIGIVVDATQYTQNSTVVATVAVNGSASSLATTTTVWWGQSAWWVDPANTSGFASDGNTGASAAAPLLSYAELSRRLANAVFTVDTVNVTQMSGASVSDPFYLTNATSIFRTTVFTILGTPTVVATGTIDAAHAPVNNAAADHYEITTSGAFTPWLKTNIMHRTNGVSAWWWPYADLGSSRLQTSAPVTDGGSTAATLAPGDSYEVLALPTFADAVIQNVSRRIVVSIQRVAYTGSTTGQGRTVPASTAPLYQIKHALIGSTGGSVAFSCLPMGITLGLFNICLPPSVTSVMNGHITAWGGLWCGTGSNQIQITGDVGEFGGSGVPVTLGGRALLFQHLCRAEKVEVMAYDISGSHVVTASLDSWVYISAIGGERNTSQLVASDRASYAIMAAGGNVNPAATSNPTPFNVDGISYATIPAVLNVALSTVYQFPSKVFETGSGTLLTFGAVADGVLIKRSGTSLAGATPVSLTGSRTDGTAVNNLANILVQLGVLTNNTSS